MRIKNKKRPVDKSIKELSEEHKGSLHHIDKRQVSIKAAEGTGEVGGTFVPSSKQLEKINQFTRVEATVDNVVAFTTMSCNDMYDRDDERFKTSCIDAFSKLPAPFSSVGKGYMVDHEYKMANARGRIFDVGTDKVDGIKFLTNDVYIPNTEQNKNFIENIDFGINWAVSVGVVIDKSECSICKAPVYSSRFFGSWCDNGHEKGYHYVPGKEEDDGWGFFLPVDPATKGAVKAKVDLDDPIDFYELSQVFLGAQYFAELAKRPGFKGMIKAASAKSVPIIGLSAKEADILPIRHEPDQVSEARQKYVVVHDSDGAVKWTDTQGLSWKYDTEEDEVLCLGKETDDGSVEDDEGSEGDSGSEGVGNEESGSDSDDDTDKSAEGEDSDDGDGDEAGSELGGTGDEGSEESGVEKGLKRLRNICSLIKQSEGSEDDEDEDPVDLAQAVDAALDAVQDALDEGEIAQAQDLLVAAEVTIDQLIELLGGTDADDVDTNAVGGGKNKASGHSHSHSHSDGTKHSHDHTHASANYDHGAGDSVTHSHKHDPNTGIYQPEEEEIMSKQAVLKAAKKAKLPLSIIESLADAEGNGLDVLMSGCASEIKAKDAEISTLKPKAEMGDAYHEQVKSDALHWYTVAHRDPKHPEIGVNVERATKLIAAAGSDLDLIKELTAEWKDLAQKLFPPSVRRSSIHVDPNERESVEGTPFEKEGDSEDKMSKRVRRIHGR